MRRLKGILNETFSATGTGHPQQSQQRQRQPLPEAEAEAATLSMPSKSQLLGRDVEEAAETTTFNTVVANMNANRSRQRRRFSSAEYAYKSLLPPLQNNFGEMTDVVYEGEDDDDDDYDKGDRQQQQQHQHPNMHKPLHTSTTNRQSSRSSSNRFREAARTIGMMKRVDSQISSTKNSQKLANSTKGMSNDDDDDDDEDGQFIFDEYDRLNHRDGLQKNRNPEYGTMAEAFTNARRHRKQQQHPFHHFQRSCRISNVLKLTQYGIVHSAMVWVGTPTMILSWMLFYLLGDPELDFLPGQIPLSWWMDFVSRQTVTLDLARFVQHVLLDVIIGNSVAAMKFLGPGISQFFIQSREWPATAFGWSLLDMIVLHGDDSFVKHWLYWTRLEIYDVNTSVKGSEFIGSILYLRLLIAMMVAGVATSVKRFLLDFQFKQRQCITFKSRLEKLLLEMILVADIAFLADHAAISQISQQIGGESNDGSPGGSGSLKSKVSEHLLFDLADVTSAIDDNDNNSEEFESIPAHKMPFRGQTISLSSSGIIMKNLLDVWEPPENKSYKNAVSVRDVLRFQSALSYINAVDPFGESFGPTFDRDRCIKSSMHLYSKLLLLKTTDDKVLSFDVLLLAISNDEGVADPVKKKSLIRLFRPDAKNHVTELAFVQSCDAVYKRLRYFQASVGNASVIDIVLASIVDSIFYFILTLVILTLLEINPWTLLVSITSLLVSISFALGPSVSKYLEGVLLIAVRRPFDLGDRIYIGPPDTTTTATPGANVDMSSCTWFVEDINLSTTTLRFARTNEVSTMNNWAIAGSKIINCNRSPGAIVILNTILHVSIFEKTTLEQFQAEVQQYVVTHPRIWDSLVFCRHDSIDADLEQVSFQLSFRHRNSWQDAGRIKLHRADLVRFIYEVSVRLKVHFETPPPRRLLYHGGTLAHGQVLDFKRNLLVGENVVNHDGRRHAMDDSSIGMNRESIISSSRAVTKGD